MHVVQAHPAHDAMEENRGPQQDPSSGRDLGDVAGEAVAQRDVALVPGDTGDHLLEIFEPMLAVGVEMGDSSSPLREGVVRPGLEGGPLAAIEKVTQGMGSAANGPK